MVLYIGTRTVPRRVGHKYVYIYTNTVHLFGMDGVVVRSCVYKVYISKNPENRAIRCDE